MAVYIEPVPSAAEAEGVMQQLARVQTTFPDARVDVQPPDEEEPFWKVRVETNATDVITLKQVCIDLLGE